MQQWLGGRNDPSFGSIAQLKIQNEASGREKTQNAPFKPWGEREMNWGLGGWSDPSGKKASPRRRDSEFSREGTYQESWKRMIDNHKTWNNVWWDVECYRRQSESSCKFWRSGEWGRGGWWWRRYRAWQAEHRLQTWLGDGHNFQNHTAPHGEFWAKADEAWRTDTTGMGGRSWLLLWEMYNVRDNRIHRSGSFAPRNRHHSRHTITDHIWRDDVGSWYRPQTITNASSDLSTVKWSNETGFLQSWGRQSQSISETRHSALFVTDGDCEASWTFKRLPLHLESIANYRIELWFGRRYGDSSCVTGGVDIQIGTLMTYLEYMKFVPTWLHVSFNRISVTKLWDIIICQCVCKGRMGHAKLPDSKLS